jgi:hypothetical protein
MPYLVQLHCDGRMPDGEPAMDTSSDCMSAHCIQPTAMDEDASKAVRSVREEARESGWFFIGQRWLCPICAAQSRQVVPSSRGGSYTGRQAAEKAVVAPRRAM